MPEKIFQQYLGKFEERTGNGEGKIFNTSEIGAELKLVTPQFGYLFSR